MIALGLLVLAVVLVILTRGSLRRLARARLRGEYLLLAMLIAQSLSRLQVDGRYVLGTWSVTLWAVIGMGMVGLLWRSRSCVGVPIMMLGFALNLAVVLANGAMPVWTTQAKPLADGFYRTASRGDSLALLGDMLPVEGHGLLSLGDLLLGVGLLAFVIAAASERGGTATSGSERVASG